MLISKPYLIFEILNHLQSCTIASKMEIQEKLNWLITRLHINSFIITNKSILKEFKTQKVLSFLNELVKILIENNIERKFIENMLDFIGNIAKMTGITESSFIYVIRKMSEMFNNITLYDGNKFLLLLRIINKYLTKGLHDGKSFPEQFFFFNNYMSEMRVNSDDLQNRNIPIVKGYTIGMWMYLENVSPDASNKKFTDCCTLFYIHTNKTLAFEAYLKKNKVYYRSYDIKESDENNNIIANFDEVSQYENSNDENNNNNMPVYLAEIEYNKWNFLLFTHKPVSFLQKPSIMLFINSKIPIVKSYPYPNVNNQKISSIGICKDFTGLLSNVFMVNDSLSQPNIINDFLEFPFGVYNERSIRIFKGYLEQSEKEKSTTITSIPIISRDSLNSLDSSHINRTTSDLKIFLDNAIFIFSPCRYKQGKCKNLIDNINAELTTNAEGSLTGGVFIDNHYSSDIYLNNGVSIFLPIFEFIVNSKYGTSVVFEEALNILINIFERKDYFDSVNCGVKDEKFFYFLSNIIQKYNLKTNNTTGLLFTNEILKKLILLGNILIKNEASNSSYSITQQYFKMIIFNPVVISLFTPNLQIELWKLVEQMHSSNLFTMQKILDATELFELIIKLYDNNVNLYCCELHYKMLCEREKRKIASPELNVKINSLKNIITRILTNPNVVSINQMINIIPLLSTEISPCLQIIILQLFQQMLKNEKEILKYKNFNEYINAFIKNNGVEHILYISSLSTLDVRYECMVIIKIFFSNEESMKFFPLKINEELIPFISITLFPPRTPLSSQSNESSGELNNQSNIHEVEIYDDNDNNNENDNSEINIIEKTSLSKIEDNYNKILSSETLINHLNLPITYIHNYSNDANDLYTEMIYTFLLKWLVGIEGSSSQVSLDDSSVIIFEPALNIIMQLVKYSGVLFKQRCFRDLYILTQFNTINCNIILKNKYFYIWILNILLEYHILKCKITYTSSSSNISINSNSNINTSLCETILSLGIKLHTTILINSILHEEEIDRNNRITRSFFGSGSVKVNKESIEHYKFFDKMMSWMYKIRKIGNEEGKAATELVRTLILNLVERMQKYLKKTNINDKDKIWPCYLSLTLNAYELAVMSNFDRKLIEKRINFELIEKNEIFGEIIQNLNYDYTKNSKSVIKSGQTQIIALWEDKELMIAIYNTFKDIWDDTFFIVDKNTPSILQDETKSITNLLQRKIFSTSPNAYITQLTLLLYTPSKTSSMNILRAILNIIMIIIHLSDSNEDINNWIRELKKYILFLIIAAENLSGHSSQVQVSDGFLREAQEAVVSAFALTFAFVLDEINSPRRKEEIVKEFTSCIRILFISFTVIIEKILGEVEEGGNKGKGMITFFSLLKDAMLMRIQRNYVYSPLWKVYNEIYLTKEGKRIFELNDVIEFKENNFKDIQLRFNSEEGMFPFIESGGVSGILKNHFVFGFYEKLIQMRIDEGENDVNINESVCYKEKEYVDKVYRLIAQKIEISINKREDRNIKDIYEMIFTNRDIEFKWKQYKKKEFTWRGKWSHLEKYISNVKNRTVKFKIANHYTSSLYCPIMYNIYDIWEYLPKFSKFDMKCLFLQSSPRKNDEFNKKNAKRNSNININGNSDSDSNNIDKDDTPLPNEKGVTFYKEFKVKQKSNKSKIFSSNAYFNNLKDKYISLEMLLKYFRKYNTSKYQKCIINISDYYSNTIKLENPNSKIYTKVCLVKLVSHTHGTFIFTPKSIHFISSYPQSPQKCHGSLFNYDTTKPRKLIHEIPIKSIKTIIKRRYYYKKNSFEIFTSYNKSYYFVFSTQTERDDALKSISEVKKSETGITFTSPQASIDKIIKEWEQWDISSTDLLSLLNSYAGRSFKDLTQYPVFPWVIRDYSSPLLKLFTNLTIRDLCKPIGAQGAQNRIALFKQKYAESECDCDNSENNDNFGEGRYFYSSHYSNSFYVVHYLYRLFPYSSCAIELQGEGFDKPSRQFISLPVSFKGCQNEATDVRELIPEFFYLPEMFINLNNIDFGFGEGKDIEFELPKWSKGSAFNFIIKNRLYIESDYVSSKLNNWVDLIFGVKQRGKEAENAMNLFFKFTYEDAINIEEYEKNSERIDEYESYISKIDFGQTPSQLFTSKPFALREKRTISKNGNNIMETMNKLRFYNSTSEQINTATCRSCRKDIANKMIIYIKALKDRKILCVFNNGKCSVLKEDKAPYSEGGLILIHEKKSIMPNDYRDYTNKNHMTFYEEDDDIMRNIENNQPVVDIRNGEFIIKGGYFDGKFLLFQMGYPFSYRYIQFSNGSKATSIIKDEPNEKFVYIGDSDGKIYIYEIMKDNTIKDISKLLSLHMVINDHYYTVNYMFICTKLNIFASVSCDRTCNLYTYPTMKLYYVIKNDKNFWFDYVFVSSCPLPSVVLYSKSEMSFYVYSINGSFIKKVGNKYRCLFSPKIINDNFHRDYLIFGTEDRSLITRRLPLFDKSEVIELKIENENLYLPIKYFDISEDRQTIYYWQLENFNLSVIKCKKEKKEDKIKIFDRSLNIESI